MATARARSERIEFRTTNETLQLVRRAAELERTSLTEFAEANLILAAQRIIADRTEFALSAEAAAAWDAINAHPAKELPGLRRLMDRPSPFDA